MKKVLRTTGWLLATLLVLGLLVVGVSARIWIYRKLGMLIGISPFLVFLIVDVSWLVILFLIATVLLIFSGA